jgi:UDP-glucose 4-epimerase
MKFLQDKHKVFEIVNLGTGSGVSVLEAIRTFEAISGAPLSYTIGPAREGDVVEIFSNVEKAKELLGWKAQYGIREMMASAWKWELQMQMEDGHILESRI